MGITWAGHHLRHRPLCPRASNAISIVWARDSGKESINGDREKMMGRKKEAIYNNKIDCYRKHMKQNLMHFNSSRCIPSPRPGPDAVVAARNKTIQ